MIHSLIQKTMAIGVLLAATGLARAERPFAAESYCFAEQVAADGSLRGIYALVEKTNESKWVYSLMSSNDKKTFGLFDGGNTCTTKTVGAGLRLECLNLETEQKTTLNAGSKMKNLELSSDSEVKLGDSNDENASVQLARGKRSFTLQNLELCTKGL